MSVHCALCIHIGDPMKARPFDVIVDNRALCTQHAMMLTLQCCDFDAALAAIRRDPQRWQL